MKDLFRRCLTAAYIKTEEGGDYAVQYEDGDIFLLFEQSNGRDDWWANLDFPARPYKRMSDTWFCHRGFLRVWKSMRDRIEDEVLRLIATKPVERIICVGYSHGAALALFATEDMAYLYGDRVTVAGYGFGAPRVLWGPIPKAVKERLRLFVAVRNIPDLVTHVPPAFLGFRHLRLERIGERGKYGLIEAHYAAAYLEELDEWEV